jgi:ribose-phosphate pyrophosphokinase
MISVNGHKLEVTIFPDKTSQVWNLPEWVFESTKHTINWKFESESELFHLVQLTKLLRYRSAPKQMILNLPYLPYARQDKDISNDTTWALHSFADIINNLNFDKVTTLDAHSKIAKELIHRLTDNSAEEFVDKTFDLTASNILVYPDSGARDRYDFNKNYPNVQGFKVRDQKTGYITEYKLQDEDNELDEESICLIVDDLCDGGATFIKLTEALYQKGVKEVHLYVSHGIFSKGLNVLKESGIKSVYTHEGRIY